MDYLPKRKTVIPMAEERGRTRFHYGFYAAMKVEYDLVKAPVTYDQEKELGEDPVRLDFLIIKKNSSLKLSDHIGEFFRNVNLFEYKSPEDGLSIDDFYKAEGYGLIYKGFDRKVNELPIEQMTLTLVRHAYPREMINILQESGFEIVQEHSGIYRIDGKVSIPVQLVVSSQLPSGEYEGLKLLAKGRTKQEIIEYAKRAVASGNEQIKYNAGTVIGVCLSVNKELSEELKEDKYMEEVVREVFKKDFAKAEAAGEERGKEQMVIEMLKDKESAKKISKWSGMSLEKIAEIAEKIGVSSIVL